MTSDHEIEFVGMELQASIDSQNVSHSVPDRRIKIIYIVGWMRSGSTLLGSLLGGQPSHFYGGEMAYAWVDQDGRVCGCGELVTDCPHWGPVFHNVKRRLPAETPTPAEVDHVRRRLLRMRRLPRIAAACHHGLRGSVGEIEAYASAVGALYREVQRSSHAKVIVDSSKSTALALLLSIVPGVQVFYIHLVRDPRQVAMSEAYHRSWNGIPSTEYPPARSVYRSGVNWTASNAIADLWLKRRMEPRWLLVRYEDLITNPTLIMDRISALTGEPMGNHIARDGSRILPPPNHSIAGNPSRFDASDSALQRRPVVKPKLSHWEGQIVKAITAGLRRRYSY